MEVGAFLLIIPIVILGGNVDITGGYFSFALTYFQDNLAAMMIMSGIFGALRIISAIGILKNRMWGFVLSLVNCTVTLILMVFLLPAGIADGILAGSAVVLLLIGFFDKREIMPKSS